MTDNEIAKALECSVNGKCPECPYFHSYPCDKCRNMRKDALDLINRLQEKNSNLTSDLSSLQKDLTSAKAEVERLKNHIKEGVDLAKQTPEMLALVKAEAYKEFAERLKESIFFVNIHSEEALVSSVNVKPEHIDNLVKEMVGE